MFEFLIFILLVFVNFLVYQWLKKRAERQAQRKQNEASIQLEEKLKKEALVQEAKLLELKVKFDEEESARLLKQKNSQALYLNSISLVPKESFLKYEGKRKTRSIDSVGSGFEFLHIADDEETNRPGVYGIYAGDVLLYVGKANGPIKSRLREHAKSAKHITEGGAQQDFLYQAMRDYADIIDGRVLAHAFQDDTKEIARLEKKLIQELKPICNIIRGGN